MGKRWLMREPTNVEQTLICRTLASLHWSVSVSYENGKAVGVQWHDCGVDRPSLCVAPESPTTNFAFTRPEDHRDPVRADIRFLRACGVRPPDARHGHFARRGEALTLSVWSAQRAENGLCRSPVNRGVEIAVGIPLTQ
jgi:hypothetical protein